jgi:RNA recognition motif-containing protein
MSKNLFVAGLSYDTSSDTLKEKFSEVGTVVSAQVIMDKYTNQSKGFGFVEMSNENEAKTAMDQINGTKLDGRTLVVKEAKPREDNSRGGGFNRSNGSGNYGRRDNRSPRNRY